jgi:hypothetical protein
MDRHQETLAYRLTEQNLNILQGKWPIYLRILAPTTSNSLDSLPPDKLARAKRRVRDFLWLLDGIGSKGAQICDVEDVYIGDSQGPHYRGTAYPKPDIQDPSFWEAKRQYFEEKYRPLLRFELARQGACSALRAIRALGSKGHKFLATYELYLDGDDDVRYRGRGASDPDFQDISYWETQWQFLEDKYETLLLTYNPLDPQSNSTFARTTTNQKEEEEQLRHAEEYVRGWPKRKKGIEMWACAQPTG